ncbi:MAG: protocatechuate 3,4-dioxygenase subunit alpha [Alphaproteobacteria bacterium]
MTADRRRQTPSQTVGPFFAYGLTPSQYGYAFQSLVTPALASETTEGERIRLIGRVLDGEGKPVNDAMVEIWQANAHGRYYRPADGSRDNTVDPDFTGLGRAGTGPDPQHRFIFDTIKPGAVGEDQAPHLNVILTMRGLLNHLYTRIYFDDEAEANARDPVLAKVPEERRATLLAHRAVPAGVYQFDIRMQGPDETVFFDM